MRRLAIALLVALLPSGCIFLTPPTGLRLGDHGQEFAAIQPGEVGAANVTFRGFQSPDYTLYVPTYWDLVSPPQSKGGLQTAFVGAQVDLSNTEGVTVTLLALPPGSDPTKSSSELADTVKANLTGDPKLKSVTVVGQAAATLAGAPATRLEVVTVDAQGNSTHMLAYSAVHANTGYILVINTPDRRFDTFLPVFESVFHQFNFQGSPTGALASSAPGASAAPGASTPPGSTLVPIAVPSAIPSTPGTPVPSPHVTASP